MSDWLSMEQKVAQTKAEAKALGDQYMEWQQPRRQGGRLSWLLRMFNRRPAKQPKPTPSRPAFR